MIIYPPIEERVYDHIDISGGPSMDVTRSQELVKQLREIKERNEITFPRIMDLMEANGKVVSLSTLRRVFANGSNADSFSYENTLLPIAEVLLHIEENPMQIDSAHAKEIEGLKAVIRCQNEELDRLHESKAFLEDRVKFLLDQIDKKDRRMDDKDEMIKKLMGEKDALFAKLMEKVL